MQICKYTVPELDFLRINCNFVGSERELFELRAKGRTLDECCELMHMEMGGIKKLSRKVNAKIVSVESAQRQKS